MELTRKGFTLIELLIVMTVIIVLITISGMSYSAVIKSSRDAKRKGDLESIRSAVELYRSNNSYYPENLSLLAPPNTPIYLQNVPQDPLTNQNYSYQYQKLPTTCNNTAGNYCTDYSVGAYLEGTSSCSATFTNKCFGTNNCNYCLGPYGQK